MADGSLTYVVPIRDPKGVRDWASVKGLIAATLASLAHSGGHIVVAATRGSDLPELPADARLVELDIPYTPLPEAEGPERHAVVRRDKSARIIAGFVAEQPGGHVMVVDYDDFVSSRLPSLVAEDPDSPGWFVDRGYLYGGGRLVLKHPAGFNRLCGTSLVVRADLLRIPARLDEVDVAHVDRTLGSHVFLGDDLQQAGTPLAPVPFAGAVYRIGYRDSTSPTKTLLGAYLSPGRALRRPRQWLGNASRLRPARSIREEFGMPAHEADSP